MNRRLTMMGALLAFLGSVLFVAGCGEREETARVWEERGGVWEEIGGVWKICKSGNLREREAKDMIFKYFNSPPPASSAEAREWRVRGDGQQLWNRLYFDVQDVEIMAIEKSRAYTFAKAKVVLLLPMSRGRESVAQASEELGVRDAVAGGRVLALGAFSFRQSELDDCWAAGTVIWAEGKAIR